MSDSKTAFRVLEFYTIVCLFPRLSLDISVRMMAAKSRG